VKFEGLAVAEAAEALGITQGMVKIRTHRATLALRQAMSRLLRDRGERDRGRPAGPPVERAREHVGDGGVRA
jgi:RNA polymerase sigma-70 factor (ECF subfamily)